MIKSENMRGAVLMIASMAAFTLNDASIKSVAGDMSLVQAAFIRGVLTTLLIVGIGMFRGGLRFDFGRQDWQVIGLRTLAELGATIAFLTALFHMPIANVTAVLQSLPLAITFAGALFFGENVGWRRYAAIAVGFAGVLMIVRPGGVGFTGYSLLALLAVGFVVLRDLSTRRLSANVPSLSVAFITAIVIGTCAGIGVALGEWQPVSTRSAISLTLASLFIVGAYLLSVMVMRIGDIAFVAPFRYTAMLWAILLGVVVFGDIPDPWTMSGSAIVIGMGLFTFYRERKLRSAQV